MAQMRKDAFKNNAIVISNKTLPRLTDIITQLLIQGKYEEAKKMVKEIKGILRELDSDLDQLLYN